MRAKVREGSPEMNAAKCPSSSSSSSSFIKKLTNATIISYMRIGFDHNHIGGTLIAVHVASKSDVSE